MIMVNTKGLQEMKNEEAEICPTDTPRSTNRNRLLNIFRHLVTKWPFYKTDNLALILCRHSSGYR